MVKLFLNAKSRRKSAAFLKVGVPKGIRTPVTAVKGRCPRPLDDGDVVRSALIASAKGKRNSEFGVLAGEMPPLTRDIRGCPGRAQASPELTNIRPELSEIGQPMQHRPESRLGDSFHRTWLGPRPDPEEQLDRFAENAI